MNTDTEAYHQSEQYDGIEGSYYAHTTLYSRVRRRKFIAEKEKRFSKKDKEKFVITQTPRKNTAVVKTLYLVDRSKTRRFWWSHDAYFAKKFDSESEAMNKALKYKYNNCRVIKIENIINGKNSR
jgi:hypothetical protein